MLCNYLQNVAAITYIFVLQLSTFLFYNKQSMTDYVDLVREIASQKLLSGYKERLRSQ